MDLLSSAWVGDKVWVINLGWGEGSQPSGMAFMVAIQTRGGTVLRKRCPIGIHYRAHKDPK